MTTDTIPATSAAAAAADKPKSKSTAVTKLLGRARGATVTEMQTATGWQRHSVRAFLSGLRKAGRTLDKEERKSGETSYRLGAAPLADACATTELSAAAQAATAAAEAIA